MEEKKATMSAGLDAGKAFVKSKGADPSKGVLNPSGLWYVDVVAGAGAAQVINVKLMKAGIAEALEVVAVAVAEFGLLEGSHQAPLLYFLSRTRSAT